MSAWDDASGRNAPTRPDDHLLGDWLTPHEADHHISALYDLVRDLMIAIDEPPRIHSGDILCAWCRYMRPHHDPSCAWLRAKALIDKAT